MHSLRKENMYFCCFSSSVWLSQGLLVWQQITRTFYSLPFFLPKYLLHAMLFTLFLFYTCTAMPLFIYPFWDFVHSRFFFPLPFLLFFFPMTVLPFFPSTLSYLFISPDLSPPLPPDLPPLFLASALSPLLSPLTFLLFYVLAFFRFFTFPYLLSSVISFHLLFPARSTLFLSPAPPLL